MPGYTQGALGSTGRAQDPGLLQTLTLYLMYSVDIRIQNLLAMLDGQWKREVIFEKHAWKLHVVEKTDYSSIKEAVRLEVSDHGSESGFHNVILEKERRGTEA